MIALIADSTYMNSSLFKEKEIENKENVDRGSERERGLKKNQGRMISAEWLESHISENPPRNRRYLPIKKHDFRPKSIVENYSAFFDKERESRLENRVLRKYRTIRTENKRNPIVENYYSFFTGKDKTIETPEKKRKYKSIKPEYLRSSIVDNYMKVFSGENFPKKEKKREYQRIRQENGGGILKKITDIGVQYLEGQEELKKKREEDIERIQRAKEMMRRDEEKQQLSLKTKDIATSKSNAKENISSLNQEKVRESAEWNKLEEVSRNPTRPIYQSVIVDGRPQVDAKNPVHRSKDDKNVSEERDQMRKSITGISDGDALTVKRSKLDHEDMTNRSRNKPEMFTDNQQGYSRDDYHSRKPNQSVPQESHKQKKSIKIKRTMFDDNQSNKSSLNNKSHLTGRNAGGSEYDTSERLSNVC